MLYYVCDEGVECVGVCGRRQVRVRVMVMVMVTVMAMVMVMVQVCSTLSRFAQIPRSATH